MPNLKSAKKALRQNKKRYAYNRRIKSHVKKLMKKSLRAIKDQNSEAKTLVYATLKALDKAAQKGVIKKNTRDRKKSRLHNKLNKMLSEQKQSS